MTTKRGLLRLAPRVTIGVVGALAFIIIGCAATVPAKASGRTTSDKDWHSQLVRALPLLGHRNWILIVDSAYPLQTSPGVETIETNASQIEVTREVLGILDRSIHVRPNVYMDTELPFVSEQDAPGADRYRDEIKAVLGSREVISAPHEKIISTIDESGRTFHVLVLKTTLTVPYTSVFLQLDCKYWSSAAEAKMRAAMKKVEAK